jgi:hypothetical protein
MGNQAQDKLPRKAAAAARKAHALQSRLARQQARIIAAMNLVGRTRGRSGVATSAFSAGASFGASLFGRPKTSIRAKSQDGKEVFHCRITRVTSGSEFTNLISGRSPQKTNAAREKSTMSSSAAHQAYIERESAVEATQKPRASKDMLDADRGREIDGAVEGLLVTADDIGYAAAAAAYIDRDTGAVISSFGNIAESLEGRIAFWLAVEKAEQKPSTHQITVNPGIDKGFWDHVENDDDAPDYLKKISASARDAIVTERLREKDAKSIYNYFLSHRTAKAEDAQTISFEPGRGGRVQTRLVMELPADMTAEQRLEIAQKFCEKEFQGVRFHCAIHSPTSTNDKRNFHFHVTFHDRPADRMIDPSTGKEIWDFEFVETKKRSNRNVVSKRPHQQEKKREFQEQKWAYKIRRDYADIVNSIRKKHNMAPIYDHRKYSEMGVEVEAVPSLSRAEFHDVQKGVANSTAASKIEKRWERALIKEADDTRLQLPDKTITKRYAVLLAGVTKRAPVSAVAVKACHGAYLDSIKRINDARLDRAALKVAIEKELSTVTPEIGLPSANAKSQADMLRQLHQHLAKPLEVQEALARESQALAVEKLRLLEKQLKSISPGSLALPLRSLGDLAARAGLSGILQMLQSTDDPIIRPDPAPVPRSGASVAPAAPRVAPQMKSDPQKAPAAIIVPPSAPTQSHVAPQADKKAAAVVEPRRLPDPQMWRIKPVVRKTPASPSPQPRPQKSDTRQEAKPGSSGQEIKPAVRQEIKPDRSIRPLSTTSSTSPVKCRFKDLPARLRSKTAVKIDQKVIRPIEPSPNTATPVLSEKTTSSPSDHKTIKHTVTRTPQSGNDVKRQEAPKKGKDSLTPGQSKLKIPSSRSSPEKSLPPPIPPASEDETARKEKERRDRRRAILTTPPHPPKGRGGGHER